MNITEIFYSLQGEGRLTGVPSVFIRVAGCPLRCAWCDTKYAWDNSAGEDLSIEEILSRVDALLSTPSFAFSSTQNLELKTQNSFIVVTGGEPMVNQHVPLLLIKLAEAGHHITVETSGIAFIPDLPVDLMSISPKFISSQQPVASNQQQRSKAGGMAKSEAWPWFSHVQKLCKHYDYQLKFVIDTEDDIAEVTAVIDSLKKIDPQKVLLMPQAKTREELIAKSPMVAELCTRYGYTFCSRLHILLWDTQKGR
jgi:7-carboxy-7-deazaguanine synthase